MPAPFSPHQPITGAVSSYDIVQSQRVVGVALDRIQDDVDRWIRSLAITDYRRGGQLSSKYGVSLLHSSTDALLPPTADIPMTVKNVSGSTVSLSVSGGATIYADTSGYTDVSLTDGTSLTFVFHDTVWYIV